MIPPASIHIIFIQGNFFISPHFLSVFLATMTSSLMSENDFGFSLFEPFRTHPTQFFMKYSALPLHSHLKAHVTCRPFQMPSFWRKTLSLVTFPCPFPMASAGGVDPRPMLNTAQLHDLGSDFWGSCYVLRSCTVRSRQDKRSGAAEWVTFLRYRPSAAQVLRS